MSTESSNISDGVTKYAYLEGGRKVAYLEKGCNKAEAQNCLLVLHGVGSSRLANMPGVNDRLLQEFKVRLVSIDRAGYGRSDPAHDLTLESAARDIANLGDVLELGDKFWLLGYSGGGAYCWAAARYIPERVQGIALWAPIGNYHWQGITDTARLEMFSHARSVTRWLMNMGGSVPGWITRFFVGSFIVPLSGTPWMRRCQTRLSLPDRNHLADPRAADMMVRDNLESLAMGRAGAGMAKDLELFNRPWGFELSDIGNKFPGPIHIWQGEEDWLVPVTLQRHVARSLPSIVHLHELPGEGHLSWFCFNDESHRKVLSTLFGGSSANSVQGATGVEGVVEGTSRDVSVQVKTEKGAIFGKL